MKKVYLTLTAVSVFGMLIFFGCSKEEAQNKEKQESVFQSSEKDLQIEIKILGFQTKVDYARANPNLKSGGDDLTLDEAVWNIEALANYNYADASAEFEGYVAETAEIEVPLTDGKVSITDAVIAYDQVIDSLAQHYSQVSGTDKHLVLADISLKETDGSTATFNVTSGIGKGGSNPFAGFGTDDYWRAATLDGKCDGSGVGSDAAEQIQNKISMRKSLPLGHRYFVDVDVLECDYIHHILFNDVDCSDCDITNPDDETPNDNMYDEIIFRSSSSFPNHHDCLIPDEMNFYLDGMEHFIYDLGYQWYPSELDGKIFASIDIEGIKLFVWGTFQPMHICSIRYGVSVGGDPPPKSFE